MSRVDDGEKHHALVQHLVVLEVVQQRVLYAVDGWTVRNTAVPGTRVGWRVEVDALDEYVELAAISVGQAAHQHDAAFLPGGQQRELR